MAGPNWAEQVTAIATAIGAASLDHSSGLLRDGPNLDDRSIESVMAVERRRERIVA